MNRNPKHHLLAAAAVLLAVLALGACSDSNTGSKSSSSGTSGASTTTAEAAKPADEAASGGNAVTIQDFMFKPGDLKVAVGTLVTFTNKDGFAHTVTAKDKAFDSGNLDKDATFEQTFDKAGTFPYLCSIHNSMTGTITVS